MPSVRLPPLTTTSGHDQRTYDPATETWTTTRQPQTESQNRHAVLSTRLAVLSMQTDDPSLPEVCVESAAVDISGDDAPHAPEIRQDKNHTRRMVVAIPDIDAMPKKTALLARMRLQAVIRHHVAQIHYEKIWMAAWRKGGKPFREPGATPRGSPSGSPTYRIPIGSS